MPTATSATRSSLLAHAVNRQHLADVGKVGEPVVREPVLRAAVGGAREATLEAERGVVGDAERVAQQAEEARARGECSSCRGRGRHAGQSVNDPSPRMDL